MCSTLRCSASRQFNKLKQILADFMPTEDFGDQLLLILYLLKFWQPILANFMPTEDLGGQLLPILCFMSTNRQIIIHYCFIPVYKMHHSCFIPISKMYRSC